MGFTPHPDRRYSLLFSKKQREQDFFFLKKKKIINITKDSVNKSLTILLNQMHVKHFFTRKLMKIIF
jgi:hypothetical protein